MSDDDSDEEMYSITSSRTFYKRARSRTSNTEEESGRRTSPPKFAIDDRRTSTSYEPVAKWAVDYNNKNYIRSKCNKNIGLHRKKQGRPFQFKIEYDNNYHGRSKVNAPKGLHRRRPDIKRKYVPDDDDLQDATGWEFDCGPEYDQLEEDVLYIPEGRIVSRGCYRWYGVKRNDSDCDVKQEEIRENLLNKEQEEELKYGHEFLQADIPHMAQRRNRQYCRGGYRWYEVPRNVCDLKQEELASALKDPEWRRKYHMNGIRYLDLDMCDHAASAFPGSEHRVIKGKPFKRTILNKVYELRKKEDPRDMTGRHATRLSLVPGEGGKSLYEGKPDRFSFGSKRTPSLRSVFRKKSERQEYRLDEDSEYEEYEHHEYEKSESRERYGEMRPEYDDRSHRMADDRQWSRDSYEEDEPIHRPSSSRWYEEEYVYTMQPEEEPELMKPPRHSPKKASIGSARQGFEKWREEEPEFTKPRQHSPKKASIGSARNDFEKWRQPLQTDERRGFYDSRAEGKPKRRVSSRRTFDEQYEYSVDMQDDEDRARPYRMHAEDEPKHRVPRRAFYDEHEYSERIQEKHRSRKPGYDSARRGNMGVTAEDFEIWRENAENMGRKRGSEEKQIEGRESREKERKESFREYNEKSADRMKKAEQIHHPLEAKVSKERKVPYSAQGTREPVIETKRSKSVGTDQRDRHSEGIKDSSRTERTSAHIELIPGKKTVPDKVPPHVEKRMKEIEEKMDKLKEKSTEPKPFEKKISVSDDHVYRDRQSSKKKVDSIQKVKESEQPTPGKEKVLKKLPPHVEKRVKEIQDKMEKKFEKVDNEFKKEKEDIKGRGSADDIFKVGKEVPKGSGSADSIDLMKHKDHPDDHGNAHSSEHEKYVTKDGNEYWVKKEEKFSQLHHKDSR